jgi:carboxymethylenebutenolidase
MSPTRCREEEIRFAAQDAQLRAVLATPDGAARAAVVLLPDVRGIAPLYSGLARKLAQDGFAVLVLDIYSREGVPDLPDMDAVFRCIAALPDRRVLGDVAAAIRHLGERQETHGLRVGIVGFCLGGQYALMAACRESALAACVSFYGMLRYDEHPSHKPESPLDLAPRLGCPLLGLFGADDALITRDDRSELESILTRERKEFSLHVFGGAGHAFLNDSRPDAYRPAAAAIAWKLSSEFLNDKLCA